VSAPRRLARPGRVVAALLPALALAALALGAPGAAAEEDSPALARLRAAIEESRERVATYEREERGLLEALEALDRSVALLSEDAERARERAEAAREDLARLTEQAEAAERRLSRTRRAMGARAEALYRAGRVGVVRLLFSADDVRDFLVRVQTLRRLLVHDRDLLARHREESQALREARAGARAAAERREAALARLETRTRELAGERATKRRLAKRVREDRSRERAALGELETAARALEAKLAALGRGAPEVEALAAGATFPLRRGRLPLPVDAPVAEGFGRVVNARFQTATFRKGIAFAAERGEALRAVAPGRVRYAGWFRGYGRIVILDHGAGWFTVSGHLGGISVEVGDAVSEGAVLGRVGESGSLRGPRLYFELRRGREPRDPTEWFATALSAR